jgi:CDP-paratose 2-epimerase
MICAVKKTALPRVQIQRKTVCDNIHSFDLVEAFFGVHSRTKAAEVYNIRGSWHSNCSVPEAIDLYEEISGRAGDHICWISDVRKFQEHYPGLKF